MTKFRFFSLGALDLIRTKRHFSGMTAKAQVLESVKNLKEDATFAEINERVRVLAAIQEGLDSLDRGEGVPIEEVEKIMASWITK